MKKQMTAAVMIGVMAAVSLAGCGGSSSTATTAASAETTEAESASATAEETEAGSEAAATGKNFKVGIVQYMDHPSLNQIEENIESELDKLSQSTGNTYEYKDYVKNGQGDASTLNQIASDLLAEEVDVLVPIATPAAQICQSAAEGKDIPIVFAAVSDPVGAKLVDSLDAPGANITGTSDPINVEALMNMILAVNPDTDYVGLLYSKSEDSSTKAIEDAKAYLDEKGIKYIEKTGTTTDEVSSAADALVAEGVDAVFTPTDNTIQKAELSIYEKFSEAGIPHYAGADSFALNGAFCGFGTDFAELGQVTADMVADVLGNGSDPATTPVQAMDDGIATINTDTCTALGLDFDTVKDAITPYCTSVEEITTQKEFQ